MLSAIILNLKLLKKNKAETPQVRVLDAHEERPLTLEIVSFDAESARVFVEGDGDNVELQIFCPEWKTTRAGRLELLVFGEPRAIEYQAGKNPHELAAILATALDARFDVTVPASAACGQRARLCLGLKTRAGTAASSTDGMIIVRSDGRGFDVEIGLDEPTASGGVVTVATEGRLSRFATSAGQHGAEIRRAASLIPSTSWAAASICASWAATIPTALGWTS